MMRLILVPLLLVLGACAHRSVLPDAKEVKVTRDAPAKDCREIGTVTGQVGTAKGTPEQALADLKQEAANKGANFVSIKQYSSYGTAVTGVAYECP